MARILFWAPGAPGNFRDSFGIKSPENWENILPGSLTTSVPGSIYQSGDEPNQLKDYRKRRKSAVFYTIITPETLHPVDVPAACAASLKLQQL
tara:strand:+ start:134 stop:412 length:279 start_codon:yes stop_codon:yes gene_type:complete